MRLWDNSGRAAGILLRGLPGVSSIAWSRDGTLIACGLYDGRVLVVTPAGDIVATCTGHTGYVAGVTWLPGAPVLASGAQDATIRIWG